MADARSRWALPVALDPIGPGCMGSRLWSSTPHKHTLQGLSRGSWTRNPGLGNPPAGSGPWARQPCPLHRGWPADTPVLNPGGAYSQRGTVSRFPRRITEHAHGSPQQMDDLRNELLRRPLEEQSILLGTGDAPHPECGDADPDACTCWGGLGAFRAASWNQDSADAFDVPLASDISVLDRK
ncbi:unnamed protein product [Lota lota]